jgi:hypothetical protein
MECGTIHTLDSSGADDQLARAMAEISTADLTTLDTEALRKRVDELGRYL